MILTLTKVDLANAAALIMAPRLIKLHVIASVFLIAIFSFHFRGNLDRIIISSIVAITLMGAMQTISYFYFRYKYIKQYDENRKIRTPTEITIINGDMVATQSDAHNVTKRSDVIKIKENEHVVVLYVTSLVTYIFPRAFVDQFPEFKQWLQISKS